MRLAALFVLLSLWVTYAVGQSPYISTPNGKFSVVERKGCVSFPVTITATGCTQDLPCDVDYESNNVIVTLDENNLSTYSHTYTIPGLYTIELLQQGDNTKDVLQIEVFEDVPPKIQVLNCGGSTVSVNIVDKNYFQYVISYNDGQPDDIVSSGGKAQHTYASAGTKTITVKGLKQNAAPNCTPVTESITVLDQLTKPTITSLEVINNSSVALKFNTDQNVLYKLEVGVNNGSTFQQIKTFYNETSDTVVNLRTEDNFYCFRLGAFNPCTNGITYSDVICSSNFDLEVLNNENRLTWSTSVGSGSLALSKRTPSIGSTLTTPVTSSPYSDTELVCGTEYCYRLAIDYPNGAKSLSLEKCGVAFSTDIPDPVADITTIVNESGLDLGWEQPVGFTPEIFSLYKSISNDYGLLDTVRVYQYADPQYTTESGSCYKISYTDVCGNKSPQSTEACPIQLAGTLESNNNITLSWNAYEGFKNGVDHYTVEIYTTGGTLLQSVDVSSTTYTDENKDLDIQQYVYIVKAIPGSSGLPPSVSNRVVVIKDPNLFYPKGFTPNGDNLNDVFNVYGQYITSFQMDIFNRWGELMFTTAQLDVGWDGNYKGNPMPEGTYTFVATITDLAGRTFKKSGSVLLLRKR
jgi:gliding motility-associated-like protein